MIHTKWAETPGYVSTACLFACLFVFSAWFSSLKFVSVCRDMLSSRLLNFGIQSWRVTDCSLAYNRGSYPVFQHWKIFRPFLFQDCWEYSSTRFAKSYLVLYCPRRQQSSLPGGESSVLDSWSPQAQRSINGTFCSVQPCKRQKKGWDWLAAFFFFPSRWIRSDCNF